MRTGASPARPAFLLGLLTVVAQVTLVREGLGHFRDNELVIALFLSAWLLAGAAGSAWPYGRTGDPRRPILGAALAALAAPWLLDLVTRFKADPLLPTPPALLLPALAAVALPALFAGAAFPRLAHRAGGARVYAAEALGALAGGLLATFAVAGNVGPPAAFTAARYHGYDLLDVTESRFGRLATLARSGEVSILRNGARLLTLPPEPGERLLGAIVDLMNPQADRRLYVGESNWNLGAGTGEGRPGRLALLQDPAFLSALPGGAGTREVAFGELEALARTGARFGTIVLPGGDAGSLAGSRFLTAETLALVKARLLAPGGTLVLRCAGAEVYLPDYLENGVASLRRTLRDRFRCVAVSPGAETVWFASDDPARATTEAGLLMARAEGCGMREPWLTLNALRLRFEPGRVQALMTCGDPATPGVAAKFPVAYRFGLVRFASALAGRDLSTPVRRLERLLPPLLLLFPLVFFPYFRTFGDRSDLAVALAFFAGLQSLAFEVVLLYIYQARFGSAYEGLGLLVGLFMAGLAAGAWRGARDPAGGLRRLLVAGGLASAALLLPVATFGPAFIALLLFLSGATTGALFPALLALHGAAPSAAADLYAADLLGAALGGPLAGLLVVPLLGVDPLARFLVLGCAVATAAIFTLDPAGDKTGAPSN